MIMTVATRVKRQIHRRAAAPAPVQETATVISG
jgi:hypothetical protein